MPQRILLSISSIILVIIFFIFLKKKEVVNNPASNAFDKIKIEESMIINEQALGDASKLIDEQQLIGDPAKGTGEMPQSSWRIGWNKKDYFPISAVIDLGRSYQLSHIYLFDAEGSGEIEISTGTPFAWESNFKDNLNLYQTWVKHEVSSKTRYIQVKFYTNVAMPEIVIYGKPIDEDSPPDSVRNGTSKAPKPIPMENFIGINAFIDDPIEKIKVAGFVREYHVWDWDEGDKRSYEGYPNNKNAWNPSYAGGGWNFDAYYKRLSDAGITIATCVQESPSWMDVPSDGKPVPSDRDPEQPASYREHADHMFQVAARYGQTKVSDDLLKLADNQERVSGLNLIQYFENWNEPDKDWKTRKEHFSPYEYAAMASADYDGHLGKMGATYGIKNADPNAQLVMGGISALNLDYIKSIQFWSRWHRGGSIPFDVINLHHYSNDGGKQRSLGEVGISPEEDSLKQKLEVFVQYRNEEMPGKEIWITEFGYDTHQNSVQRAPAIGQYSMEEVQAIWLVRSYLAIAAAGIDRAAMYMLRDTENTSGTQFSMSGLTQNKFTKHIPKPSWYYLYTLKTHLKNTLFSEDLSTKEVMIYKFKDQEQKRSVYLIWSPTSSDKRIDKFKFQLAGNEKPTQLVNFVDQSTEGKTSPIQAEGNQTVILDIEEKPLILITE